MPGVRSDPHYTHPAESGEGPRVKFPDVNPPPPQSGVVPCLYCNEALDVGRGFEQVIGLRSPSGRVSVVTATGRWVCPACAGQVEAGQHPLRTG